MNRSRTDFGQEPNQDKASAVSDISDKLAVSEGTAVQPDAATVEAMARTIYDGLTGRYKLMEWPEVHRELQADYRVAARAVLAHAASAPRPPAEQAVLSAVAEWIDHIDALYEVADHVQESHRVHDQLTAAARALRPVRRQG